MDKVAGEEVDKTRPVNLHEIPSLQRIEVRDDILLRPMSVDDAASILQILGADVTIRDRVAVASKIHSPEDVKKEVDAYKNDPHLIRYVIQQDESVIGLVSLWRDIDTFPGSPDSPDDYGFGYFLDPNKRGAGIVSESVNRLMEVAQNNLFVRQFIAYCEDDNDASLKVLGSLGFHPTPVKLVFPDTGWAENKFVREVSK